MKSTPPERYDSPLVLVPVMYYMNKRCIDVLDHYGLSRGLKYVPFLVLILKLFMKKEKIRKTDIILVFARERL